MTVPPNNMRSRRWGPSHTLRLVCAVLAVLAVAGALVIVLLPLPRPAAGGTCGPGNGSESALEAFSDPVSIGAGPRPSASDIERYLDWQAFVGECQAASNGRVVDALALVVLAAFFALAIPPAVRRAWGEREPALSSASATAPPGWYPDPANPTGWRWWHGQFWGHHTSGGGPPPSATATTSQPGEPVGSAPMYPGEPVGGAPMHPGAPGEGLAGHGGEAQTESPAPGAPPSAESPPLGAP